MISWKPTKENVLMAVVFFIALYAGSYMHICSETSYYEKLYGPYSCIPSDSYPIPTKKVLNLTEATDVLRIPFTCQMSCPQEYASNIMFLVAFSIFLFTIAYALACVVIDACHEIWGE